MELNELRERIDGIDAQLVRLLTQRMGVSAEIAACKRRLGKAVYDPHREREKLDALAAAAPEELREYVRSLYPLVFELSRSCQNRLLGTENGLTREISSAISGTQPLFPQEAAVACQGVEGAYSQLACDRLFRHANIFYFQSFDAVFSAIEKGLCRYGIVPLENSTAGSVNAVYDLMMRHDFRIVRSVRLKVDHNLLVKPGTRRGEIREIYSHAQAISQCAEYLRSFPGVRVIPCENTAAAAKLVAESSEPGVAALSSRECMRLYGLECLEGSVQDRGNNYTRFICISKSLEIYPGADRTSIMAVLPHEPGSLYRLLGRFYALGINLNKLESRPLPDRDFEFMFYFDLETSIYSPEFMQLMGELQSACDGFSYLGSYSEVV